VSLDHEPIEPGASALARAFDRWRRARLAGASAPAEAPAAAAASPPASSGTEPAWSASSEHALAELARRLDDSGCGFGRVSAARLDHLTRAYDRLETKLNAILMAVTGTFLSTLASLLLYYLRGGSH